MGDGDKEKGEEGETNEEGEDPEIAEARREVSTVILMNYCYIIKCSLLTNQLIALL